MSVLLLILIMYVCIIININNVMSVLLLILIMYVCIIININNVCLYYY